MSASAQALVEAAAGAPRADGGERVVVLEERSAVDVRWARGALTTNGWSRSRAMTVVALRAGRVGIVARTVERPDDARALAADAEAACRASAPLQDVAPLVAAYPAEDGWDAAIPAATPDALAPLLGPLARSVDRWRRAGRELHGYAEHARSTVLVATSTGLRRRHDDVDGRVEINGKAAHGRHSSWAAEPLVDADADAVAGAVEAALGRVERGLAWSALGEVELPAGHHETLLSPSAVADLMVFAYQRIAARDAHDGRSAFARAGGGDRVGERLARLPLTLASDPAAPGLACAPFVVATVGESALASVFDTGQPIAPTAWIEDGVLRGLASTRAWAAAHGAPARPWTGNLMLSVPPGAPSLDAMIATTERGLLVTSLWYVREVDAMSLLLTGLTRDGVHLVEDGRVVGAVNNFRFNESPLDLLGRATEAGATVRALPRDRAHDFRRTAMAPLRVPDFLMSSVSRAA